MAALNAALKSVSVPPGPAPLPPNLQFGCQQRFYTQKLDHSNSSDARTFQQMYQLCAAAWPKEPSRQKNAVILL